MRWRGLIVAVASLALACGETDEPESMNTDGSESGSGPSSDSQFTTTTDCGEACETDGTSDPTRESNCADGVDDDGDQLIDCDDTDCQGDLACGDGTIRLATWNTLRINPEGSAEFDALVAIVQRIDADILCVQEVGEGEESALQAVVEAAGYVDGVLAPATGPPGAGLSNACMSRTPTVDAAYLWSDWISPDPGARDLTRPFVRIRVEVPNTGRFISVVSAHLKAGEDDIDLFRRMVESIRLAQAAQNERAQYPNNAVVVMGDLNYTGEFRDVTFDSLPAGLPSFYSLGNDIQLPLAYDPDAPLLDAGLMFVDARFEDGNESDTFIPAGIRLDYVYAIGAQVVGSEVYEACSDDGVDAPPEGDALDKVGDPLDCGLSEVASDHRPVVVDLRLQAAGG